MRKPKARAACGQASPSGLDSSIRSASPYQFRFPRFVCGVLWRYTRSNSISKSLSRLMRTSITPVDQVLRVASASNST